MNSFIKMLMFIMLTTFLYMPTAMAGLYDDVDENIKEDMLVNPDRYMKSTSLGTGAVLGIDKESIDVEMYNPPHYIINFKAFTIAYRSNGEWITQYPRVYKIYYKWNDRKAYIYGKDHDTGIEGWQELSRKSKYYWRFIQVADDVFKIAYNIKFFTTN